jgi:hypothetical protein
MITPLMRLSIFLVAGHKKQSTRKHISCYMYQQNYIELNGILGMFQVPQ